MRPRNKSELSVEALSRISHRFKIPQGVRSVVGILNLPVHHTPRLGTWQGRLLLCLRAPGPSPPRAKALEKGFSAAALYCGGSCPELTGALPPEKSASAKDVESHERPAQSQSLFWGGAVAHTAVRNGFSCLTPATQEEERTPEAGRNRIARLKGTLGKCAYGQQSRESSTQKRRSAPSY